MRWQGGGEIVKRNGGGGGKGEEKRGDRGGKGEQKKWGEEEAEEKGREYVNLLKRC